jgi:hypothetical protein
VYLKTKALRTGDEHYNRAARFWARIFGINFALGVVTEIPMEFQFGEKNSDASATGGWHFSFSSVRGWLPVRNAAYAMTVHSAKAVACSLKVGLIWWFIGRLLAALYFTLVYRSFAGKVVVDRDSHR